MIRIHRLLAAVLALVLAPAAAGQGRSWDTDILRETFGFADDAPSDVPWEAIEQGCPRRDCIASIDSPRFVAAAEARFLADDDLVIGLELDGEARAYPTRILNYHEIVNDRLGSRPLAVTWCPLCGSGMVFERSPGGTAVEFGVSGLLHNSDLIMYDRASESLWQQITGKAFAGPRRGQVLETVPSAMTTWHEWRTAHPDTRVLAPPSDHSRYATATPYGDYDSSDRLLFPVAHESRRLHPKEVVHGVEFDGIAVAVTERALRAQPEIETDLGGHTVLWRREPNGRVRVETAAGEPLTAHRMFWFAWYTFHVDTALHDLPR